MYFPVGEEAVKCGRAGAVPTTVQVHSVTERNRPLRPSTACSRKQGDFQEKRREAIEFDALTQGLAWGRSMWSQRARFEPLSQLLRSGRGEADPVGRAAPNRKSLKWNRRRRIGEAEDDVTDVASTHTVSALAERQITAEAIDDVVVGARDLIAGQRDLMRPSAIDPSGTQFALAPDHALSGDPKSFGTSPKLFKDHGILEFAEIRIAAAREGDGAGVSFVRCQSLSAPDRRGAVRTSVRRTTALPRCHPLQAQCD